MCRHIRLRNSLSVLFLLGTLLPGVGVLAAEPQAAADSDGLVVQVYDMRGLIRLPDTDTIIVHLTRTVLPNSWVDAGGMGFIEFYPDRAALVVSNTEAAHRQIAAVLAKVRPPARRPRPAATRPEAEAPDKEAAEDAHFKTAAVYERMV